jgi:hypothetical protein
MASTLPHGKADEASPESASVSTFAGVDRDRILAKMTPQRGQATGPGLAWPQRGQLPLPAVSALVDSIGVFVKDKMVTVPAVA